jgi:hypothetical protein
MVSCLYPSRELVDVQPDGRTAYMGDDGSYTAGTDGSQARH